MKKIILLIFILLLPNTSYANRSTPYETVGELSNRLQSSGNLGILCEYVDWETIFEKLSNEEKSFYGYGSGEDLKKYYKKKFEDSETQIIQELKNQIKTTRGKDREKLEEQVANFEESVKKAKDALLKNLHGSTYSLISSKELEDKAQIVVKKTTPDSSTTKEFSMSKRDGTWYFEDASFFNPIQSGVSSPVGGFLSPAEESAME